MGGVLAMTAFLLIAVIVAKSFAGMAAVILAFTAALLGIYIARQTLKSSWLLPHDYYPKSMRI